MAVIDDVKELINRHSGLTEVLIAEELPGAGARQQRVNPSCRQLAIDGRVERRGRGGKADALTYYPVRRK